MPPLIALLLWFALAAFLLFRDHKNHPDLSSALYIPLIWLFFLGSKSLGLWLNLGKTQMSTIEVYAEGNAIDRYSLLLLFALAIYVVLKRNFPWPAFFKENRIVLFFFFFCMMSLIWSDLPFITFKRVIRFSGILPMALLLLSETSPHDAVMAVLRRCSYLLVSLSFLFIKYFPQFGRYYNPYTGETGYCGVGGNKNELGIICLLTFLVILSDITQKLGNKRARSSVDTWTTDICITCGRAPSKNSPQCDVAILRYSRLGDSPWNVFTHPKEEPSDCRLSRRRRERPHRSRGDTF